MTARLSAALRHAVPAALTFVVCTHFRMARNVGCHTWAALDFAP